MNDKTQVEQQLYVLRKLFDKMKEFNSDGTRNKKYFPLKNKIAQVEKELSKMNWNDYLSK